jgi:uncharacterized DUF497 family protein
LTNVRTAAIVLYKAAMRFEWDEEKNELNLKRHRMRFETATLVFDDPRAVTLRDVTHEEDEERFITLGWLGNGVIAFVVHTCFEVAGEEVIRLISARKATPRERKLYEAAHKRTASRHRGSGGHGRRRH